MQTVKEQRQTIDFKTKTKIFKTETTFSVSDSRPSPRSQGHITVFCKTLYFRCILISRFWDAEISLHFNLAFPSVLLVFTRTLMGKLNFRGYLISQFYPTREIRENLMHAKNVFYSMT